MAKNELDRILGMDVMKELQKLVDMATVGGKKEKTEEDETKESGMKAVREFAKDTWEFYTAFTDVGFSADHAFALTLKMIDTIDKVFEE